LAEEKEQLRLEAEQNAKKNEEEIQLLKSQINEKD